MNRARAILAVVAASAAISFLAPQATAASSTEQIFVGFGAIPSDARAAALAAMRAFSPSCVEISTVFSPAGSAHTWKATLTAEC